MKLGEIAYWIIAAAIIVVVVSMCCPERQERKNSVYLYTAAQSDMEDLKDRVRELEDGVSSMRSELTENGEELMHLYNLGYVYDERFKKLEKCECK